MEDKIIEIISTITNLEKKFLEDNMHEQKLWESFSQVELVIALEEEFDISFSPEEISEMTSVAEIFDIVNKKVMA